MVCLAVPFLDFVFGYLVILVHELGHTIAGWALGYPSIPSFDLFHGGGVTLHQGRQPLLLVAIYAGWGALLWRFRHGPNARVVLVAAVAVYTVLAFTEAGEVLALMSGHLAELAFGGIFLWRALRGTGLKTPAERPAYAFAATFVVLSVLRFAFRLTSSASFRDSYESAKGGGWMDLSQVAAMFRFLDLQDVAALLLLVAFLVPVGVFVASRRAEPDPVSEAI